MTLLSVEPQTEVVERLGVQRAGQSTTFSLFSHHAEGVDLCLFERPMDRQEAWRLPMERRGDRWRVTVSGLAPGTAYGFRIHGPYDPEAGHRFNPTKLLLDPYAQAIAGTPTWHRALYGYAQDDPGGWRPNHEDSAPFAPRSVLVDGAFDWREAPPPQTPLADSVIYELHVKGFTARHPELPPGLRGTYAGLAHPAVIDYLQRLGVTAVELLPVHASIDDRFLVERGLRNYWGYQTVGFFAPQARYAADKRPGAEVAEFKRMVRELHRAGIEVLLDVVYNHTAEANHLGPTLAFRGIDNAVYYRFDPHDCRHYLDYTGTGNTLRTDHPQVQRLILDSLRYWVEEMGVDGFRFDLATVLGREGQEFQAESGLLAAIAADPALQDVKLIAEPWDIGPNGYQVGRFPPGWSEWNDRFRDTARGFWRGVSGQLPELGARLTGSADLFARNGRPLTASVNFVTAHDGFTLFDLVTYSAKRNASNGELNRDGAVEHLSNGLGRDGYSTDPELRAARLDRIRALLTTLLLARGVPMLLAGDERGRTQLGNNNAYCHDDPLSWVDWTETAAARELRPFVERLIALRRDRPLLRSARWPGSAPEEAERVRWFSPAGEEMSGSAWHDPERCAVGYTVEAREASEALVVLMNADTHDLTFQLPAWLNSAQHHIERLVASSSRMDDDDPVGHCPAGSVVVLGTVARERTDGATSP